MAIWICPVLNEVATQSSWLQTNARPVKTAIQRHFYRTGRVREEIPLRNGHRHGVARTWYKNGLLASEEPYQNGVPHGICRQWDEAGRLLGRYKMVRGTGIQRAWHDNGRAFPAKHGNETRLHFPGDGKACE